MITKPRVLFWDIETSLQTVAVFQLAHNDWIDPSSIISERYVICAGWKWQGEDKVHTVSVLDDPKRFAKDPYDDKHVIQTLHKVLSEADVIVHHNGDSFDKRYVDTRILFHELEPLPPITSIDTYKVAKTKLLLNSNKLNYIGGFTKVGQKKHTSSGLWMRVLKGEKKAIQEMVAYNKQDVLLLEKVYLKLRPYIANHVNRQLFGRTGCPRCGSHKTQSRGTHVALTRTYQRFHCQNCGGWFRSLKPTSDSTPSRTL